MVTGTLTAPRGSRTRWVVAVCALAVLAIAGAISPELRWLHYACKPLTTLLIAGMVVVSPSVDARYRGAVLVGLLLSMLGDVFLMLVPTPRGPDWFVFGLASFLCAHVAYLYGFCCRARLFARWWPFALYAVVAVVVSAVLAPRLPEPLRWPVYAYVLILSVMAAQAAAVWARSPGRATASAALGGAFFVVSDATLAMDRFVAPFPAAVVVVLATYWIAQTLIGLSACGAGRRA
ncbi:lysoplasmalogenase [Lysobacter rhizosphaerae]